MYDWIILLPNGTELAFVSLSLVEAYRLAETVARNNRVRVRLEIDK